MREGGRGREREGEGEGEGGREREREGEREERERVVMHYLRLPAGAASLKIGFQYKV